MVNLRTPASKERGKRKKKADEFKTTSLSVIRVIAIRNVPTLRLKALNKHNTHNVHRDGEYYPQLALEKRIENNADQDLCFDRRAL